MEGLLASLSVNDLDDADCDTETQESLHLEYMRVEKELWIMKEKEKQKI